MCQMFASMLVESITVSSSATSLLWIFMSMIFGFVFTMPSIEIQALIGMIIFGASQYATISIDIENFAVMLFFFWWIQDAYIVVQHLFSHLLDDLKPPRMAHLLDDGRY